MPMWVSFGSAADKISGWQLEAAQVEREGSGGSKSPASHVSAPQARPNFIGQCHNPHLQQGCGSLSINTALGQRDVSQLLKSLIPFLPNQEEKLFILIPFSISLLLITIIPQIQFI